MKRIILGLLALTSISSFASSQCFVYFQTLDGKVPSKKMIQALSSFGYKSTRDVFKATHIARHDAYESASVPLLRIGLLELYTKEAYLQRNWKNGIGYAEYLTYSDLDSHFLSVENKIVENFLRSGVKCGEDRKQIGFEGNAPHSGLEAEFGHEGYL